MGGNMKEGFWVKFWMEHGRGHTVRDETYIFLEYKEGYKETDDELLKMMAHDWCQYENRGYNCERYHYGFDVVERPPAEWLEKELKKLGKKRENIENMEKLIKSELGMDQ